MTTLGESKQKTLMLLDEYSSGGEITVDEDIMNKMNLFFDLAQKDMATYQPIIRTTNLEIEDGWANLPDDFKEQFRIWKDGKEYHSFPIVSGRMYMPNESGEFMLEYVAHPATITMETPDTYEFEVADDAANALPFYVAAQQLIVDLVVDYQALWNMYITHKSAVNTRKPSSGFGRVRQALF